MNANDNDNSELNLIEAAEKGDIHRVKALIDAGANVHAVDNDRNSALHKAALNGSIECVKALLKAGAELEPKDNYGNSALHKAALNGRFECVRALIDAGANVRAVDDDYKSALHKAALNGRFECVRALINAGAELEPKDNYGKSALHKAALNQRSECVKALLKAGAELEPKDNYGNSALHLAANYGRIECVRTLLEAGAELEPKDNDGNSALHLAALNGHIECVRALLEAGADPSFIVKSTSESFIHQSQIFFNSRRGQCVKALQEAQQKLFDLKNVLSEANTNSLSPSDTIGKINGLGLSEGYIDNLLKQAKKKGYPKDDLEEQINEFDITSPDLMEHVYQEVAKFHGEMAAQIGLSVKSLAAHSDSPNARPHPAPDRRPSPTQ